MNATTESVPDAGVPLVELTSVSIKRSGEPILDRVSMSVAHGTIHLLIGPNGAGKSTLLSAVLGRIDFSGTIRCHFRDSGRIGYVPQALELDRTLPITVGELLALSHQRHPPVCLGVPKSARSRIRELLELVGLRGSERRPLGALSGGEMQRILLAQALEPTPELLILDEPASGLDARAVEMLERTLLDLKSRGVTALMVSHDMRQARRLADRVTVLARSVRSDGAPADVLSDDPLTSAWE